MTDSPDPEGARVITITEDDLQAVIHEPEDVIIIDLPPDLLDLSLLGSPDFQAYEERVIQLTNQIREQHGLSTLTRNERLEESALAHTLDMAENRFISHTSSDGSKLEHRVARAQYRGMVMAGENLAMGHVTPESAVQGWMDSPGHRANLLRPEFREIGVAYIEGEVVNPDGTIYRGGYWVQNFGSRTAYDGLGPMAKKLWDGVTASRDKLQEPELDIVILEGKALEDTSHGAD